MMHREFAKSRWIVVSCVSSVILATMAESWFYVANVMDIDDITRGVWKNALFWSAVLLTAVVNVVVAIRSDTRWWRRIFLVMGTTFLGMFSLVVIYDFLTGRHSRLEFAFRHLLQALVGLSQGSPRIIVHFLRSMVPIKLAAS